MTRDKLVQLVSLGTTLTDRLCPVSIGSQQISSQQISSHIFPVSLFTIYFKSNTYIEGLIYVKHMSTFTWQVSPAVKLVGLDRLLLSDHMHGHDQCDHA